MRKLGSRRTGTIAVASMAFAAALFAQGDIARIVQDRSFVTEAEAIIGRPATPGSVAGVARRTTRRVVYRTAIYVPRLPATGCVAIVINNVASWQCGATYYQAYGTQYVVVQVQ